MRKFDHDNDSNVIDRPVRIAEEIAEPASFKFDPNRYRAELDAFDISEERKQALMATLWDIMCRFVQLGFSVDVCSALLGDDKTIPSDDDLE